MKRRKKRVWFVTFTYFHSMLVEAHTKAEAERIATKKAAPLVHATPREKVIQAQRAYAELQQQRRQRKQTGQSR